ncbi:lytic polysaccharide monooxygenase auxiliary activity family 9 protein [Streptomyces sp. NPDC055243]|uniref:lytic polysaccharide monooxygenase auxiliary activity family 9 protein n=1 Tax=Streptomyces sp. NPDC055243 TaxID=3365720 RepID=UPI0037D5229D
MTIPRSPVLVRARSRVRNSLHARRLACLTGATGIAAAAVLAVPGTAAAHGVAMVPGSRTYLCYKDLLANSSTQMPTNPACKAAVQEAGTTPLYNWFAVLDSNAGGRGEGYVEDGTLCSAGDRSPYAFSPYNAARTDWPVTHLTAGATVEVNYSNWAHHPGQFKVYVTKEGFDPQQPLGWSDLESVQTVQNPPQNGGPGSEAGHYYWDLQLPERSGRHMLFVQWIRSDSQENFFSCSDVVFDGGNGEVTGLTGGKQSSAAVTALGAGEKNTKADAVHEDHGGHEGHGGDASAASRRAADAAPDIENAASDSPLDSPGPGLISALAGAGAAVLVGGTVLRLRQRRPSTTDQ